MTNVKYALCMGIACLSCAPQFDDQPYLIERPRLIGLIAEPAEARPRAEVVLEPIVAGRGGVTPDLSYRFCTKAPPPADPRSVSEACLEEPGILLQGARGALPSEACGLFGPDPVGSSFRPHDADGSGGFYQPIVVEAFGERSVTLLRIGCLLPDVPVDLARELQARYVPNQNPRGAALERRSSGAWQPLSSIAAGERVSLRLSWPEAARERYVWLPPDGDEIQERLEAMRVAWFVTGGRFDQAFTGRAESDTENDTSNLFVAPERPGSVQLWAMLHDSRGGSAVVHQTIEVVE